jgi:peptide/nickel transport system substrate-binding protein
MDLQLLGPIEARLDGRSIPLGPTKQRAVLAMLALHANATVGVDRLIDGLWGEDPPATAPKMIQLYVSQLRRLLAGGDAEIVTHGRGYELRLGDDAIDATRFERLVEQAGRPAGSSDDAARRALALWHGAALADVASEPFAAAEIRRLDQLRLRAAELSVEDHLAAGRCEEALAELERLIEEHPLRERPHAHRMLALYRSGRQAEALEAYLAAHRRLVDEAGVEPGAELRELHERILRQDPLLDIPRISLDTPPEQVAPAARAVGAEPARDTVRPANGRRWVVAAVAAVVVGLAVFAFTRLTGDDRLLGIDGGAVGAIDADAGTITEQYDLGFEPGAVAAGVGSVWVANPAAGIVARIHRDGDRVEMIDVGRNPSGLAFGAGSLWVAGGDDGDLVQVDPAANRAIQRIHVGNGLRALAVGYGAVWAAAALDGEVVRIDRRSGRVTKQIAVGGLPVALAVGSGAVWVAGEESRSLVRIDPRTGNIVKAIPTGHAPSAVAVGLGAVWTVSHQDGTVSRVDPATNRVTHVAPAGREPIALAVAAGELWVADAAGAVRRFDAGARPIAGAVRTGGSPAGLAVVGRALWTTAVAPPSAHRGGTLRIGTGPMELDPGWAGYDGHSHNLQTVAYDGLVGYRRAAGVAGTRLVADLAIDVPPPTDGGRRYVFRLRPGLHYSDGTRVHASDFRASMERMLAIEPGGGTSLYETIKGAPECLSAPTACDLSRGIATDDRTGTISIRLRRPDPDLPEKLAVPLASVLPATTPRKPARYLAIPGTGPYRVDWVAPGLSASLTRNPYFRPTDGRPAGFADRIAVTMSDDNDTNVAAVERGQLDFASVFDWTAKRLTALRTRVGSRVRSGSWAMTEYAVLNARTPPFDDPRVRRALNLAVDRERVVELIGGREAAAPTCQLLPPGLPGYRPTCPFTVSPSPAGSWTAPDLTEARRLVAASGHRGTTIEVWTWSRRKRVGQHLAHVLRDLGFRPHLRVFPFFDYDGQLPRQLAIAGWIADSAEPAPFLRALVACDAYRAGDPASSNSGGFCDPGIDAAIDRAQARPAAGDAWQRVERRIAAQAPLVPLDTRRGIAILSRRAGNLQFAPLGGLFLEQLRVR